MKSKLIGSKYRKTVNSLYKKYKKKDFTENFSEKKDYACYYCLLKVDPKNGFEIKLEKSETYHVYRQCLENYEKIRKS